MNLWNLIVETITKADKWNAAAVVASFALVLNYVNKGLAAYWNRIQLNRKGLLELPRVYPPEVFKRATKYYVWPDGTNVDPNQEEKIRRVLNPRMNLYQTVKKFLSQEEGNNHMFLLADSGMGKTTFLLNVYVRSRNKKIVILPLGRGDVDERISGIENKQDVNLFLDALDEDPHALKDHVQRVRDLMNLSKEFRRVLITCRTQFFLKQDEIPSETGIVKIGPRPAGEGGIYTFWKFYLSPLTDRQVHRFLCKKYPFFLLGRQKAQKMVKKINDLRARPMILTAIPDLLDTEQPLTKTTGIYQAMIDKWILRERRWISNGEDLLAFSKKLALNLFSNREKRRSESIPAQQLKVLAREWDINLGNWQLTGRSLLVRDAEGNYRLAHRFIMEFLFITAYRELENPWEFSVSWTDQMFLFQWDLLGIDLQKFPKPPSRVRKPLALSGIILERAYLQRANLQGAHLEGANLMGTDLHGVLAWKRVKSWEETNIHGVNHAPVGFREHVLANGGLEAPQERE